MHRILQWFSNPTHNAPRATMLLRLMAGSVFLWEGILKFVVRRWDADDHSAAVQDPPACARQERHRGAHNRDSETGCP
jgi:hypothetical protein